MEYLLDTNACMALINGQPATVRARLHKEVAAGGNKVRIPTEYKAGKDESRKLDDCTITEPVSWRSLKRAMWSS